MRRITYFFAFVLSVCCATSSFAQSSSADGELISFSFAQEELVNVVNLIAGKKGVNLLLPTRSDERITGKLTWHIDEKIPVDQAWNLIQTILSMSGYTIVPYPTYSEVVKTNQTVSREPVPLYINVPFEQLPATNQHIRYMYHLANIKSEGQEGDNEALSVLKAYLPPESQGTLLKLDSASNTLIIGAQSNDIRAIMPIIASLDKPGFQEKMEIISLKHTQARRIADLFNNQILDINRSSDLNRYRLDTKKPSESSFFSKHIRIVANERQNNLIVLGRPQAIDRTRNFIKNYLDVAQDTGRSILHTYRLQYLNAAAFADVLRKVLASGQTGGLEQATGARQQATGPQRYFDEVIIAVDTPDTAGAATGGVAPEGEGAGQDASYYGGNTLIIAARNDDWRRIEELIGKLDQPSPQVLIEVLITDLTLDDTRALGSALRNPANLPIGGKTAFQSAQLAPGIMPETFQTNVPDNTIGVISDDNGNVTSSADLLRTFGTNEDGTRMDDGTQSIASGLAAGSTVISYNDCQTGETWGITQILKTLDHSKILSHPHVISTSGQTAKLKISEIRLVPDQASGSAGSQVVATNKNIEAALKVDITPRIAVSDEQENAVNLQVVIDINQFASQTNNTRTTRNVTTNVTINTGDILALGGLIRSEETERTDRTPVLSQIPIIGWLFKKKRKDKERTNLTVFISPTVILPRERNDMLEYTKDYLTITRSMAREGGLFDSLKDPITRWFFTSESPTEEFSKEFIKNDVRFQDTPMPQAQLSPTKGVKKTGRQREFFASNEKEHDELKDLFKQVDNPFKGLTEQTVVQNE